MYSEFGLWYVDVVFFYSQSVDVCELSCLIADGLCSVTDGGQRDGC